jgi:hypothetical protein
MAQASTDLAGPVRAGSVYRWCCGGADAGRIVLGLGRIRHWERIAVVGDADWLRRAIHARSWAMPGEVRVFASDDLDDARAWVMS